MKKVKSSELGDGGESAGNSEKLDPVCGIYGMCLSYDPTFIRIHELMKKWYEKLYFEHCVDSLRNSP